MKRRTLLFSSLAAVSASRPSQSAEPVKGEQITINPDGTIFLLWDFSAGSLGWLAGFSDYSLLTGDLRRQAEILPLPPEIGIQTGSGFYVQSMNRSDDMFMFLKKPLGAEHGLKPNQSYQAHVHIKVASNAPGGCIGVGGAPGEAVVLKAGVTPEEPVAVLQNGSYVGLNLDKGNQSEGGSQLHVVGNIANGNPCELPVVRYQLLSKVLYQPNLVRTDESAGLWVTVGTDSGYEGLTQLYYYAIAVALFPA